ncbi:MAG: aldo/keto reductase, partial [Pseudomonadota bacterium]
MSITGGSMLNSSQLTPKELVAQLDVRLGFGGGDIYGGDQTEQSTKLIHKALDSGIQYFDTARLYGNGSGEGVLGRCLSADRDRIILTSKVGITPWSMRTREKVKRKLAEAAARMVPAAQRLVDVLPPARELPHTFSVPDMKRSLERSLKELRTDYLDILLLHEPTAEEATRSELLEFLNDVQREGKVRAYGFAGLFNDAVEITTRQPSLCRVTQFPSDVLNQNLESYQPARPDQVIITHSVIKHALMAIQTHFAENDDAAAAWKKDTGAAASDTTAIVKLLLADALA